MIFLEVTCEFVNFFLCKSGSLRVKGTVDALRGVPDEAFPVESPGRRKRLATHQARARDSVFPSVKWAGWTRQALGRQLGRMTPRLGQPPGEHAPPCDRLGSQAPRFPGPGLWSGSTSQMRGWSEAGSGCGSGFCPF